MQIIDKLVFNGFSVTMVGNISKGDGTYCTIKIVNSLRGGGKMNMDVSTFNFFAKRFEEFQDKVDKMSPLALTEDAVHGG